MAAGALTLFIVTLQPDFGGPEDTPKFQFLGHVLGSAHPPGYPLYVLLTHAFVHLPIRSIAYRANLFSAVMASVACAMTYTIARQIGAGRLASGGAALGMASGAAFWRGAVFAEVYSLGAAIASATVSLLLSWGATRRPSRLFSAAAVFAAGLGNHLTLVGLAPASAAYVLMKDRRVLTPRVLAALAVIGCLGLAQYGLIVIRTRQAAPYMESRAETLPDLWRVITAERFAGERFAFGPAVLLTVHLPSALRAIAYDLGAAGVVLCGAGVVALAAARSAGAALLIGGFSGVLAMVVNLSGDVQGFVTPILPLVWPFAAAGIEAMGRVLSGANAPRRVASFAAGAMALAVPAWNLSSNYARADQSASWEQSRFLRAFYSQLPDGAAVVAHDYQTGMALNYMTLTGEGGPDRGIGSVGFSGAEIRHALNDGRRVFTFAAGATVLSTEGFRFQRMRVAGPALEEWLAWLPRRTLVAGASAHVPFQLDLRVIGHAAARPIGRLRRYEAFALFTGTSQAQWRNGDERVSFRPFDGPVTAGAGQSGARIERDGRTIAYVPGGLAVAAFSSDGSLVRPLEFPAGQPADVAFDEAVYEITGGTPCVTLTEAWRDITPAFGTGSWVATLHQRGSTNVQIELANSAGWKGDASVLIGNGVASPVTSYGAGEGPIILSSQLTRTGDYRPVFRFALNDIPATARARIVQGTIASLSVCSHEPLVPLFPTATDRTLLRPDFEAEPYFGAGWSSAERTSTGRQRRGRGAASLFLPLERRPYRLVLELDAPSRLEIDILVNGTPAGGCDVSAAVRCEMNLPAAAVRQGLNTLTFVQREPDESDRSHFAIHRVELSR